MVADLVPLAVCKADDDAVAVLAEPGTMLLIRADCALRPAE